MTIIITEGVFKGEQRSYVSLKDISSIEQAIGNLDLASDTDPVSIIAHAKRFDAIRIAFPSSHDGRGNSIASALRRAGYTGYLRAFGNVLADQYPLVLRSGFDDVEISIEQAARQPERQWRESFDRMEIAYLKRLKMRSALYHTPNSL